jgi:hypothetical protein
VNFQFILFITLKIRINVSLYFVDLEVSSPPKQMLGYGAFMNDPRDGKRIDFV